MRGHRKGSKKLVINQLKEIKEGTGEPVLGQGSGWSKNRCFETVKLPDLGIIV